MLDHLNRYSIAPQIPTRYRHKDRKSWTPYVGKIVPLVCQDAHMSETRGGGGGSQKMGAVWRERVGYGDAGIPNLVYFKSRAFLFKELDYTKVSILLHIKPDPVGGFVAQWKHSCFPPAAPLLESRLRLVFSPYCLVCEQLRSNPSGAEQLISQTQLAVTSRA